jgi:Ca-activated chloride channel family protein
MIKAGRKRIFVPMLPFFMALLYCLVVGDFSLRRPDQIGFHHFKKKNYQEAGNAFADPLWKGTALFKAGDFKQASGVFSGQDTPLAAYNQANSLVMQGQYRGAIDRYDRALELSPDWGDAKINRGIAMAREQMLKQEGGEGTGGMLGADEIVFSEGSSSSSSGEEVVSESVEFSEVEMQALWLRQVQTKPADFLRAKFSYQFAAGKRDGEGAP